MTSPRRYARADNGSEPIGPGAILLSVLNATGRTQAGLARSTGLTTKHVNQVVQDLVPVSIETAKLLQTETGIPARLWLALDANYRLVWDES